MEVHSDLDPKFIKYKPDDNTPPREWFKRAYEFANEFYYNEISRAKSVDWNKLTPEEFFVEYIWVVHATGFSAKAVSKFINKLIAAYGDFRSPNDMSMVLNVCNNKQKATAVLKMAKMLKQGIEDSSWEEWKENNIKNVDDLSKLPYIGNITKYHLGRNIGMLDCVKPDLHFERMTKYWGYGSSYEMIVDISKDFNIKPGIADMIAWYYASTFGTLHMKTEGVR